jgi:hypothetical protein
VVLTLAGRATRLGQFSSIWLHTIGQFFLRKRPKFMGYFFPQRFELILPKNGLGYILGIFFANSSGRPVAWASATNFL